MHQSAGSQAAARQPDGDAGGHRAVHPNLFYEVSLYIYIYIYIHIVMYMICYDIIYYNMI